MTDNVRQFPGKPRYGRSPAMAALDEIKTANAERAEKLRKNEGGAASFLQGVACAVAALVRDHDMPTLAASILFGHGLELVDFIAAEVDDYDLDVLRKLYETEAQLAD